MIVCGFYINNTLVFKYGKYENHKDLFQSDRPGIFNAITKGSD